MFGAIVILLALPVTDRSVIRGNTFKMTSKLAYYLFIFNFVLLGNLGQLHVEVPFIALGQAATLYYFAHYLVVVPLISTLENLIFYLSVQRD